MLEAFSAYIKNIAVFTLFAAFMKEKLSDSLL